MNDPQASTRRAGTPRMWIGLAVLLPVCAGADTYRLEGAVIAAGGGSSRSEGGCYALRATIGEAAVGRSSGGGFTTLAGFWGGAAGRHADPVFHDSFEECR